MFARATLAQKDGARKLMVQLTPTPNGAQALAFLAQILRDHGGLDEAALLLKRSTTLKDNAPATALAYLHILELAQTYPAALEAALKLVKNLSALQLGPLQGQPKADVMRILAGVADRGGFDGLMGYYNAAQPSLQEGTVHEFVPRPPPSATQAGRPDPASAQALSWLGGGGLDVVAALMAAVKILYITGDLHAAAELTNKVVGPMVAGLPADVPLHKTLIRNEAAYYACAAQLMTSAPPPPYNADAAAKPIYLVGDSHVMPAAWRHVTLRGEKRLLVPALVTGCKAWHLRPEGSFYPKKQFDSIVASLPKGAKVMALLGEIDCREALTSAVERLKYESLEEAAAATAAVYVQALRDVARKKSAEMLVHPVPPVLDATRQVVLAFNAAIAADIAKLGPAQQQQGEAAGAATGGVVRWLDFEGRLLQSKGDGGSGLADGLEFDGVHMSPKYLSVLDAALATL